jgi:hypothetical protein
MGSPRANRSNILANIALEACSTDFVEEQVRVTGRGRGDDLLLDLGGAAEARHCSQGPPRWRTGRTGTSGIIVVEEAHRPAPGTGAGRSGTGWRCSPGCWPRYAPTAGA